ncbi:MAG: hypothetical protein ASARMPREDX12_000587 [Alectoria sarmentosa]|nr:MAG: hypothetical protein ASARMPREDX12_000587 [Alectoria sarmentosa]
MADSFYPPRHLYYDGQVQPLADIHAASHSDIDSAIQSAQRAFHHWSTTPPILRSRVLLKAVQLLRDRNDEIARTETQDTGKPFSETSTVDVVTGADVLEFFANLVGAGGLNGETTQLREDAWVYTKKEPLGVYMDMELRLKVSRALWKSAPCLAAGNTMVYKPSEVTPLHGQILAEIFTEAGLPPGVFNVVQGGGDVGAYLTSHEVTAKVSFTGQVSTGKKVASSAAAGMKYTTMELGGKSPVIILPDADLEQAVDGAMMANFFSTGQVCTNGTRVFIPNDMKQAFEEKLLEKMKYVRAGDLMDMNTNFGPLVSEMHYDKVIGYIKHGVEKDRATLLCGGPDHPREIPGLEGGYWVRPTVFTDCTDSMRIVQEEIFGPVMTLLTYKSVEEAIERANATALGLAAGVFTKDLNMAHRVIAKLEAGITWVNTWGESPAEMSVGGWKQSGVGVENGKRGLEAWVRNKSTLVDMSGTVPTVFSKL